MEGACGSKDGEVYTDYGACIYLYIPYIYTLLMSIIVERRERERENKKPPQPRQTTDTAQLRQTTDTAHWQVSRSLIDKKKHWQAHRKFSTVKTRELN